MKKKVIVLSILASAIVGGLSAWGVSAIQASDNKSSITNQTGNIADANYKFVSHTPSTEGILPDFTQAAEKGVRAVVNIEVKKQVRQSAVYPGQGGGGSRGDIFEFFFGNPGRQQQQPQEQRGGGSGVIISEDGYIISNNHVVEDATEIRVTLNDGASYKAKVVGTDPSTDVALLKVEAKDLPFLPFGNSDDLRLGQWVLAIGSPFGLSSTVTQGIISAKGRSLGAMQSQMGIESFIQTDAAVNPGNSGGALITLNGELIGINTMIISKSGGYNGLSFAVPSTIVRKVAADIRQYGMVQRALLGVTMQQITEEWIEQFGKETGIKERGGIYIYEVVEGGAAAAAGIKKNDVMTHINDVEVKSSAQVQETIGQLRPNDKIKITVKRDGSVKQFDVTLRNKAGNTNVVSKSDTDIIKVLGAEFRNISDKQMQQLKVTGGVQVTEVFQGGLLAKSRVRPGLVITAINDTPIRSVERLEMMEFETIETIEGVYPDGRAVIYSVVER